MPECCDDLSRTMEDGAIVRRAPGAIADGRILNDIFSGYYLRFGEGPRGYRYYALKFCPFCGRGLSYHVPGASD